MKSEYRVIIDLVKSAITGEKVTVPENIDWSTVLKISKAHQIFPIIYYGLQNSRIVTEYDEKLFNRTIQASAVEMQQLDALEKISSEFSKNGVDHLFLKGSKIKFLYPKTEMRMMCDLDILIKEEQRAKAEEVMLSLGFEEGEETDHELHWRKGLVSVELHKILVPHAHTEYSKYFGNGWDRAIPDGDIKHKYKYTDEDQFIFVFGHLAKHYRHAGIGIRHLVDIWVMLDKLKTLNKEYIIDELKKLKLNVFYENVVETVNCWMGDGQLTEVAELITNKVFGSGSYGQRENISAFFAAQRVSDDGKFQNTAIIRFLKMTFLNLSQMKGMYPILNKLPILLPVMWVVRWFRILFTKPENITARANEVKVGNNQEAEAYEAELKKVGLNFNSD